MPKFIDMTGWKMWEHGIPDSRLMVIERGNDKYTTGGNKVIQWLCECSCEAHTRLLVKGSSLRNGNTKSCGCLRSELVSHNNAEKSSVQVGNVYGKLTVIQDLGMRQQQSRNKKERWSLCQCDCGSEPIEVKNNMLQSGWKKSCGCLQSQGEFIIEKILKENDIQYIKEYKIHNLKGENGGQLRFDFAIFDNNQLLYLIEFDGKQHFFGPEADWKNGQSFETIQHHDKLKNEYCKENGICLKRIPYTKLKQINYKLINSTYFNITKK